MIHSALVRLTLYYVALIMLLSISFSVILYNVSTSAVDRSFRKSPPIFFQSQLDSGPTTYDEYRQDRIDSIADNLRFNLFIFNCAVFFLGGAVSYALARRTFEPIEKSIEAQSRFTADASHELRTPLTAMKTEIEVALRDSTLTKAEAKEILQSNLEEVSKLTLLSNALLKLARLETKPAEFAVCSSKKIAENTKKSLQKTLKQHNIELKISAEDFRFDGDPDAIGELMVILVDNAVKYGDSKPIELVISQKGDQAVLSVTNSGKGIDKADITHIFDRFYRADESRSKLNAGGYGLGLSLAKQIADMHHGKIIVQSTANAKTTFTVTLPVKQLEINK